MFALVGMQFASAELMLPCAVPQFVAVPPASPGSPQPPHLRRSAGDPFSATAKAVTECGQRDAAMTETGVLCGFVLDGTSC